LTNQKQYDIIIIVNKRKEVNQMTIGYWVFVIVVAIIGLFISATFLYGAESVKGGVCGVLITVLVVGALIGGGYWYYNNTADGARALKDQHSNLSNGLQREIILTAEDGREIFYYKGKCDIETDHSNYVLFEDEEGNRQIIYKGVQDTLIISEITE
jgi:hypothetical protein